MHRPLIRVADARDNDTVVDLSLRAWRPVFESYPSIWGRPLFERFYPDWAARQASDVANALNTSPTWVVAVNVTIAGFVNVTFDDQTLTGEIYMIAVDPNHQHRGLGSLLTQHALSQMRTRGMTLAILSTGGDPGHRRARATYERNGFTFPQVLYSMLLQTDLGEEPKLPSGAPRQSTPGSVQTQTSASGRSPTALDNRRFKVADVRGRSRSNPCALLPHGQRRGGCECTIDVSEGPIVGSLWFVVST